MTLKFEAEGSVAIDHQYGIEIRQPRIASGGHSGEVEYQYTILIRQEVDGLGFYGADTTFRINGMNVAVSQLLLSPADVLQHVFRIQAKIGNTEAPFTFLCAFARGLIGVYETGIFNYQNSRYVVLAEADVLASFGMDIPVGHPRNVRGQVVLAELNVPYADGAPTGAQP